jgi:hypothetical protein
VLTIKQLSPGSGLIGAVQEEIGSPLKWVNGELFSMSRFMLLGSNYDTAGQKDVALL